MTALTKKLERGAAYTVAAAIALLTACASSICVPVVHLPAILAIVAAILFLTAFIYTTQSFKELSTVQRVGASLLSLVQLCGISFIAWSLHLSMRLGNL